VLQDSSAITTLPFKYSIAQGRLIFSRSSLQGPNDGFIICGLHGLEADLINVQGHIKMEGMPQPEQTTWFAEKALPRSPEGDMKSCSIVVG
jgi:hypothetical protein